jgi:hypothetical protein
MKDIKTTITGAIGGFLTAFGPPIWDALHHLSPNFKMRDVLTGIGIAIFGKLVADSKKGV